MSDTLRPASPVLAFRRPPSSARETLTREDCERRCIERLKRLDAVQIQIAELVIAAIARGAA